MIVVQFNSEASPPHSCNADEVDGTSKEYKQARNFFFFGRLKIGRDTCIMLCFYGRGFVSI